MTERILALFLLAPFLLVAVAAIRFYVANPDPRPRDELEYRREVAEGQHVGDLEARRRTRRTTPA